MQMNPRLAIFLPAASTSQLRAAQRPAEWRGWDLAQVAEEACAQRERATLWTPPTGAPPPAIKLQRSPSHQTPWIPGRAKGAIPILSLPHMTLCLMVRDTPAPSPPSRGHTATPCTYGGITRGRTGETRDCWSGREYPPEPAASSSCPHSCSTAHCLATLGAPPEKKT